jgi:hypothetical protein
MSGIEEALDGALSPGPERAEEEEGDDAEDEED